MSHWFAARRSCYAPRSPRLTRGLDREATPIASCSDDFARDELRDLLAAGTDLASLQPVGDSFPVDRGIWRAPLRFPTKILAIGLNYADHAREAQMEILAGTDDVAAGLERWEVNERPIVKHTQRWTWLWGLASVAFPHRFQRVRSEFISWLAHQEWVSRNLERTARHVPTVAPAD
jgi:hypothetical protein